MICSPMTWKEQGSCEIAFHFDTRHALTLRTSSRSLKELHVRHHGELESARADSMIELANLVAHYVQEQNVELEEEKVIKMITTRLGLPRLMTLPGQR